jgi:hypothetical protein
MANINTPISAAETKAQMENAALNPETVVGGTEGSTAGDLTVCINLTFAPGQTFKPKELYEALDAKFGTVASLNSTVSHGSYDFLISV